ncbi:MAG: substrate-binding domain-containing protein [Beijerinckiaceae bacterium]|nr:substrate-binding domain-containing protein [Beijerinckiaceae bacterium]
MESVKIGGSEPLTVLSAGAVRGSLIMAAEAYHAATGCAFSLTFDTAGGVEKRAASEAPDVFASSMDSLRAIAKAGALSGEPRAVGSARIALGVRAGERAPDISTLEAFKAALRSAEKIARGDPGGGGTAAIYLVEALTRIGIMEEVADKSVLRVGGVNVMKAVADGLADFGITQSTEIVPVKGVEIGAWVPAEVQLETTYGVALGAKTVQAENARAFIAWLATPDGARHFSDAGFFPAE